MSQHPTLSVQPDDDVNWLRKDVPM